MVLLSTSLAAASALAYHEEEVAGGELTLDEMTKDKMDALEAREQCETDCVRAETELCNANHDVTNHLVLQLCLGKVGDVCEKSCP